MDVLSVVVAYGLLLQPMLSSYYPVAVDIRVWSETNQLRATSQNKKVRHLPAVGANDGNCRQLAILTFSLFLP